MAHAQPALAVAARLVDGVLQLVGLLLPAAHAGGRVHGHRHAHAIGAHGVGPLGHEGVGLATALAPTMLEAGSGLGYNQKNVQSAKETKKKKQEQTPIRL